MDLDSLTLKDIKQIQALVGSQCEKKQPYKVGEKYFIRTVTLYYTGEVAELYSDALVLKDAAWIPDTGRFYDFLKDGKPNEVEPFPDNVIIPLGSIIDMTPWKHALLRGQK